MTRRPTVITVLRKARRYIAEDLDVLVDCHCLHDAKGRPIRETMDDTARPFVERAERLIAEIDAVIWGESHG